MPLRMVEPHGVNTVGKEEWVEIDVAVDSGATETVMSAEPLDGVIDITEGPALARGVKYEVANGVEIPNLGERKFVGVTEEGVARSLTAQICAVNKTLMSVSKVAKAGNRVVFDDDGGYIEDKSTGERIWMEQIGGMYHVEIGVSREGFSAFLMARAKRAAESDKEESRLMPIRPATDESHEKQLEKPERNEGLSRDGNARKRQDKRIWNKTWKRKI